MTMRTLISLFLICLTSFGWAQAAKTPAKTPAKTTAKADKIFIGKYDHVSCGEHCSVIFIGDKGKEYDGFAKTDEISGYKLIVNHETNPEYLAKKFKVCYFMEKDPDGGFDHITITKVELQK